METLSENVILNSKKFIQYQSQADKLHIQAIHGMHTYLQSHKLQSCHLSTWTGISKNFHDPISSDK